MKKELLLDLLQAIKKDDYKAFSKLVTDRILCTSFGRFPMLSLCYMYKSAMILEKFENSLKKIKTADYSIEEEPFEIYTDFREIARKSLRLFLTSEFVFPEEMLALMARSQKLSKEWLDFDRSYVAIEHIKKIYAINFGEDIEISSDKISLPIVKNVNKTKDYLLKFIVFCMCFVLLSACCIGLVTALIGLGTTSSPIKVDNINSLVINADKVVALKDDIKVENQTLSNVNTINGNGRTIYLSSLSFIDTLDGVLENLTIVVKGDYETTDINTALIKNNNGTIKNVNIKIDLKITEKDTENDLYISALVGTNNGTIQNCSLSGNANIIGNAMGNAYYSSIASINNGEIIDVSILDGAITSSDVDLAGIVIQNKGKVTNTQNKSTISQIGTDIISQDENMGWNPNCSGIAIENTGTIQNCINYGDITANSLSNKALEILISGIATKNSGSILSSNNHGKLTTSSPNSSVYAGGIVSLNRQYLDQALSTFVFGTIENSRNFGDIDISNTQNDASEIFSGGITGVNQGKIVKSANSGKQTVITKNGSPFIGGIAGINTSYTEGMYTSYASITECRSDSNISLTFGKKQSFVGGLVGNNNSILQYSFTFAEFTITDANNYADGENKILAFVGSVVGVDNISRTLTGWSSATAYNSAYCANAEQATIGAFVYQNSIVSISDKFNKGYNDKQAMINTLNQEGRYWE